MEPETSLFPADVEDAVMPADTDLAEGSLNQPTVRFAMRELRSTLRNELQSVKADVVKMLAMQTSLMGKMVTLDAAVQGVTDYGSIQTATAAPRRRRCRSETRLHMLSATFGDFNAAVLLIQLACIITTTSVSKRLPALRGRVSEAVVNYLVTLQNVAGQDTGFGALLFAVR